MSELLRFFKDMRDNGYGLAEIAAQLGTSAIAEPVAGFAAMYDPQHGADAIREGMTYQPRSQAAQEYSQSIGNAAKTAIKPAMPIIDTWKKGVDIAGRYSPVVGAGLRTVPTAIGIAMGAKPALQAGRQVSEGLGAMQGRMIANANAPRTLNAGYMGQRGAVGVLDNINPTGKVFTEYDPKSRANAILAKNIVTIDKTMGGSPDDYVLVYRGAPKNQTTLNSGDFVTTNKQLAKDYAGDGVVISQKVKKSEILDDINEPLGEEYIYKRLERPLTEFEQAHLTAQRNAALPVSQGGLGLRPDNTAMDRARAMGFDVEAYHTSRHGVDVDSLDSGKYAIAPFDAIGTHFGTKEAALDRFNRTVGTTEQLKGSTYPVLLKGTNPLLSKNGQVFNEEPLLMSLSEKADYGNLSKSNALQREQIFSQNSIIPYINDVEMPGSTSYIAPPSSIRSRFAAFDPFNRDSSNLLAQTAKLAPTTALGAYMYNEKRKKSQGKQ